MHIHYGTIRKIFVNDEKIADSKSMFIYLGSHSTLDFINQNAALLHIPFFVSQKCMLVAKPYGNIEHINNCSKSLGDVKSILSHHNHICDFLSISNFF